MLAKIEVGKPLPEPWYSSLAAVKGERSFCVTNTSGGIDVFVVLDGISAKELDEFKGSLSVIYQDLELPFLVLKYAKMSFDMPLLKQEKALSGNALNIYVVELKGFILRSYRVLGLNENITAHIKQGFESVLKKTGCNAVRYYETNVCKIHTSGYVQGRYSAEV